MQARCPHCQEVFATPTSGVQTCPRCGRQLNVPDLGIPARGPLDPYAAPPPAAPPAPGREPTPWENRSSVGLVAGFLQTFKRATFLPGKFWPSVRPEGSLLDALLWAWLVVAIGSVLHFPFALSQYPSLLSSMDQMIESARTLGSGSQVAVLIQLRDSLARLGPVGTALAQTVPTAIFYPLTVLIQGALLHLCCVLLGCSKNGFNATLRVLCYASGPLLFLGIPVLNLFAGLWAGVLVVWGLRHLQETNEVRAMFAVASPMVILCCCLFCAIGAMVGPMAKKAAEGAPTPEVIELGSPLPGAPR